MSVALALVSLVTLATVVIGALAVSMDISQLRIAEATFSAMLLGLVFGTLALALGCATGNTGPSIGVASAFTVLAYMLNALAPMVEVLEPFRWVSPFYYYIGADPITNGLNPWHALVLIAFSAAFVAVAKVTFERRDLGV